MRLRSDMQDFEAGCTVVDGRVEGVVDGEESGRCVLAIGRTGQFKND